VTFTLATVAPALRLAADADQRRVNALRLAAAIRGCAAEHADLGVVVLPLGCFSAGAGCPEASIEQAPLDVLTEMAREAGIWIAGADRFAATTLGFLVAPDGEAVLVQPSLSETDGAGSVAVLDTRCGRLAVLVDGDLLHPEYARLAMFAGAELLLNPCAERADERAGARALSRGSRAWENHVAVASCGLGVVLDDDGLPAATSTHRPRSMIWSAAAQLLAEGDGSAAAVTATIDLGALRQRRTDPWVNFPAQLRTGVYAPIYAAAAANPIAQPRPAEAAATEAYDVLLMQAHQVFVGSPETRDATIADNLERALGLALPFCARPSTRLVVLPEFFLQGSGMPQPLAYWERVGIRIPGPETERLASFARRCDVYVCGAVLEYDPEWPLRFFNTSIIVSPQGEIVLRYRKLQCADLNGLLNVTTPGNIYSQYVERYGIESLVPVVDTPIGRLGTLICFDSNWPELWRALALRGAEVICNPTSEIHSNRRGPWYAAKRAHAAENRVYVASANAGSEQFYPGAAVSGMNRGHSALIDFNGELAACADGPGTVPLLGRIELGELRRQRARAPGRHEGRFRPAAVARAYADFPGFPLDCFLARPMVDASEGPALVRRQLERLRERGVIAAP
jgi:predicted amidohydrolase